MKRKLLFSAALLLAAIPGYSQSYIHTECGTEFTIALRSDSTLWACGNNANGQLGVDTSIYTSDTLMPVLPSHKWIFAATGAFHTLAIASDSTLWGWGLNVYGQLGTGTNDTVKLPTQVSATAHWRFVSAGMLHTVAIRGDGTLWSTGFNYYGQIGNGDTTQQNTFVQIGTANNWQTVSAGGLFTMAIKQDGTLWGWGYNYEGELGIGNTSGAYITPTQVGTGTDWVMVGGGFEFTWALKSDGTIWSTGFNGNGQLGRATSTTMDSLFTQIGSLNNWKFVAAGASFGYAIKQDGTLWACGYDGNGQLGIRVTGSLDTLTQVGTDNTWQYISGADGYPTNSGVIGLHAAGFKTADTALCTAGADYIGQLGNGTTIAGTSGQYAFICDVGELPTAISNIPAVKAISVYPNPAYDQINIDGLINNARYTVEDIVGNQALNGQLHPGANNFSILSLTPGVYVLSITSEQGTRINTRFVKE